MRSSRLISLAAHVLQLAAATCLVVVVLEGLSLLALRWLAGRARETPIPSSTMRSYGGTPWADTYWREQRLALAHEFHPFGLWRTKPFAGKTITVDSEGLRRTYHSSCEADAYTVYLFGGSSVWGYGSPDWETIPSLLAKRYVDSGRKVCIVNYGEDSWRSVQGVVKLALELKRPGPRPDLVVFLNGCNDLFTPFILTGRADLEWDTLRTKRLLDSVLMSRNGGLGYLEATNTIALARRLATRLKGPPAWPTPRDPDGLARQVAEDYFANMDVVDALARGYGFRYAFFWQPLAVAGRKRLTPEEEEGARRQMGRSLPLFRLAAERTYPLIRGVRRPGFFDLAGAFDDHVGSVYIDCCHFLPEGNRVLADRIYGLVQ